MSVCPGCIDRNATIQRLLDEYVKNKEADAILDRATSRAIHTLRLEVDEAIRWTYARLVFGLGQGKIEFPPADELIRQYHLQNEPR